MFLVTILLIQHSKFKKCTKTPIWIAKIYWSKNFTKGYHTIATHALYDFMSLISFILSAHVHVHTYFLWRHYLPPDKSENDQDSDTNWFTYCINCHMIVAGVAFQCSMFEWVMSCFGNDNKFLLPKHGIVLFFICPTLYSLTILFAIQPFSLQCHSRHK
jgi:hypothetical protein